jgi:hypothetical protein
VSNEIDLSGRSLTKILRFLEQEVGPRKYWIHSKVGGEGWVVNINNGIIRVTMSDDQMATFMVLKFKR